MKNIKNNSSFINIHWVINTLCNYKCNYCYAREDEDDWNKLSNKVLINETINNLNKIPIPFNIILLGGEPTLHPNINYIIQELKTIKNINEIYLITNGYKNIEGVRYNLTYHPSQITPNEFIKKINNNTTVLFLYDYEFLNDIYTVVDYCKTHNIQMKLNIKYKDNKYISYSNEDKNYIKLLNDYINQPKDLETDIGNFNDVDVYLNDLYYFEKWDCNIVSYYIPVKSSKIFMYCINKEVNPEDITLINIIQCPHKECICLGDISNEKTRIIS